MSNRRIQIHSLFITSLVSSAALLPISLFSGCSGSSPNSQTTLAPAPARIPTVHGPSIDAGSIPPGTSQVTTLSNGAEIVLQNIGGVLYHEVEGTMTKDAYTLLKANLASRPQAERDALISRELKRVYDKLGKARALILNESPSVAYFTFLLPYTPELLATLKQMNFDRAILLNPVTIDRDSLRSVKAQSPAAEGLVPRAAGPRDSTRDYSGLEALHAPAFVARAEADIGGGVKVNGSSVNLGITDTGITLNHPTFRSALDGRNRITYLKDFTREGRVYFNPTAKFEAMPTESADALKITAEIYITPRLPDLPLGDKLTEVKDLVIQVSDELKKTLTTPGSGAKLGVLLEESINAPEDDGETVDINGNGKVNDKLWAILVPGASPELDAFYLDASGTGDFRDSPRLSDWNTSKTTQVLKAETVGFQIQSEKLTLSDGKKTVVVRSASIVGFDPGNHGSHVAGIAAGSKTIANDDGNTLARGVAPEAKILMERVCANNGGCGATAAIVDLATVAGAEVINMSLGGLSPFNDGYGVQETVVNRLTQVMNTLFVISAGNSGPGHQTVGSPSTARLSLSVGAAASRALIERQYQYPGLGAQPGAPGSLPDGDAEFMFFFSSRGPTAAGGFKPNVSAPGTELSAVQLNAAPGARGGLDVYWGTSMAAPSAAGAYALLLDAIKKYNVAHPEQKLASDVLTLRTVLIDSARPFDVSRFDPETGEKLTGQYTWVDQGKGMVDLTAAWKKLFELRSGSVGSAVKLASGEPAVLDYQTLVSDRSRDGAAYDGTRAGAPGAPAFGVGLYLDAAAADTLRQVHILRQLPENLASGSEAGPLTAQLQTTREEFVLKTVYYGTDQPWLKAGTLDQLDCANSPTSNLTVLGRGAEVHVKPNSTGEIVASDAGTLNICIDRQRVSRSFAPGEYGALISAYRTEGGKVSNLPSFVVPVYINVPHKTLADQAGYRIEQTVRSFEVNRNFVRVPKGTSLVKVTLEVPKLKLTSDGQLAAGERCSSVELMALSGGNTSKLFKARKDARVSNCTNTGAPITDDAKRSLTWSTTSPAAGIWDLHVFGSYKNAISSFVLKVDYLNSSATQQRIDGTVAALNGSFGWKVLSASLEVLPDNAKSVFELSGLKSQTTSQVAQDQHIVVPSPMGVLRAYAAETKSVTITIGGSKGNDLDLTLLECPATAASSEDAGCASIETSGGATDVESVTFTPKKDKVYAARVDGFTVKNDGAFVSTETIKVAAENGSVSIATSGASEFTVSHSFSSDQMSSSKLLNGEMFASGKYSVSGALQLKTADGTLLFAIPVEIRK